MGEVLFGAYSGREPARKKHAIKGGIKLLLPYPIEPMRDVDRVAELALRIMVRTGGRS
jgi:hypothetical protein